MVAANSIAPIDTAWYLDSGATDHLTADLNNLSLKSEYQGPDQLKIGNGSVLPITHIGSSSFHFSNRSFMLNNILRVPTIAMNLLSVSKLCTDNDVFFEREDRIHPRRI